jgi:hypothetical protein
MDIHSLGPIDPGESFTSGDDQMKRVKLILSLRYGSITTQALTYEFFLRAVTATGSAQTLAMAFVREKCA